MARRRQAEAEVEELRVLLENERVNSVFYGAISVLWTLEVDLCGSRRDLWGCVSDSLVRVTILSSPDMFLARTALHTI